MLRRLVLCALALCALVALAGCGVNRIAAPQLATADHTSAHSTVRKFGGEPHDPPRTDDGGGDLGGGGGTSFPMETNADSLGASLPEWH